MSYEQHGVFPKYLLHDWQKSVKIEQAKSEHLPSKLMLVRICEFLGIKDALNPGAQGVLNGIIQTYEDYVVSMPPVPEITPDLSAQCGTITTDFCSALSSTDTMKAWLGEVVISREHEREKKIRDIGRNIILDLVPNILRQMKELGLAPETDVKLMQMKQKDLYDFFEKAEIDIRVSKIVKTLKAWLGEKSITDSDKAILRTLLTFDNETDFNKLVDTPEKRNNVLQLYIKLGGKPDNTLKTEIEADKAAADKAARDPAQPSPPPTKPSPPPVKSSRGSMYETATGAFNTMSTWASGLLGRGGKKTKKKKHANKGKKGKKTKRQRKYNKPKNTKKRKTHGSNNKKKTSSRK